jgi:hypothetical protein
MVAGCSLDAVGWGVGDGFLLGIDVKLFFHCALGVELESRT